MTPHQKIKATILVQAIDAGYEVFCKPNEITEDTVDDLYEEYYGEIQDIRYEFREGQFETEGICKDYSQHYETQGVAAKMFDGSYVGWTYWYGGGKHGEPEAIDWMEAAYDLDCVEEEKLVIVRTFTKKES